MSTVDAGVGDEGAADLWGGPAADPVSPNIPAAGVGVHGSPDSCDASATGRHTSANTHFCAGPDACSSAAAGDKLVDSLSPAEAAARQFAAQRDVIAMALSGEVSPAEVAEAKMELEEGGDLAPKCLTSAIFNISPTRA